VDLYTLTPTFLAQDPIDQFVSAIWTERYSSAGDMQLVVPATSENVEKLADGTFMALRGSNEVMQIATQNIEDKLLTVTGETLIKFLDQRLVWFKNPYYDGTSQTEKIIDYTEKTTKVGAFLSGVVDKMVINPVPIPGTAFNGSQNANLNWTAEKIDRLTLGAIDATGDTKMFSIPIGTLYSGLSKIATDEGVGISLYLESADPVAGYSLKFKVYRGVDHTTGGAGELVRLEPDTNSIQNVKELRSMANYKNAAYVYYQGIVTEHWLFPDEPTPEGFDRRTLMVTPEGSPPGHSVTVPRFGGYGGFTEIVVGPADIAAFRDQAAKDALANNNYIRAIDGQSSPASDFKFGTDYGLGDIIELEGLTGLITKARVTEYIRSQDKSGEKEYPTISVIQ